MCKRRRTYGIVGDEQRDKWYTAFEADRFNRSRTSPRRTSAVSWQILRANGAQDFVCGLPFAHATKSAQLTTIFKERLQQSCAAAG